MGGSRRSGAVVREADVSRGNISGKSHPLPHRFDDAEISVDTGVDSLLPTAVLIASVTADVVPVCLTVRHTFGAFLSAFRGYALLAV